MHEKSAGQASVENLIIVGIIAAVFVLMLISVAQKNYEAAYYKELFENQNGCSQLSLSVSLVFAEGKKNFELFELDSNASVSTHIITIGNTYCSFIGTAVPAELVAGTIKIKNETGDVEFEQISSN